MIRGKRIILRALEPADAELLYQWENQVQLWSVSGTLAPFSRHALEQYIHAVSDVYADKQLRLMISLQQTDQTIGCIDLYGIDFANARAAVGILIADPQSRQKGYAGEAVDLVVKYAFEVLHLHQVYCTIPVDNEKSISLFRNHGFSVSCTKKEWSRVGDTFMDELLLQRIAVNEEKS